MGVRVAREPGKVDVWPVDRLQPLSIDVCGDISSAAPFIAAATLLPDSELHIRGVNVNPTRTGFLDVLERMGGRIAVYNRRALSGEPVADLEIRYAELVATNIDAAEVFGAACPRVIYYMAKIELHRVPWMGQMIRAFGAYSVRRGESDREAVRLSRELVSEGRAVGLFVEGTRQKSGVPGEPKPGASMIALQEGVPVVPAAIHGSQFWKPGNFHPVSIAWGEPMDFTGLPKSGKGYREALR